MRAAVALASLAALPVLVFGIAPSRQPAAIVPKPVVTEGIRAQKLDAKTFNVRWTPVAQMPPAIVRVLVASGAVEAKPPAQVTTERRVSLKRQRGSDVCARHGMRRIVVTRGRWSGWRCRR